MSTTLVRLGTQGCNQHEGLESQDDSIIHPRTCEDDSKHQDEPKEKQGGTSFDPSE